MFDNFWTHFNWLDVVLIIVIIRIVFIGVVQGLVVEFFKILGIFFATFLGLHYFIRGGKFLHQALAMPSGVAEMISFLIVVSLVVLTFKFIREGWLLILKMEAKPGFSQWGGGALGAVRGLLICSLVLFFIYLTGNQVLVKYADHSMVGSYLRDLSPKVYKATFDGFLVKFFPDEENNKKEVFNIVEQHKDDELKSGK